MTPIARRALSQTLSRLANASAAEALRLTRSGEGDCRRVGITGPPGAGKSSLIARLARCRLRDDGDLAIIAIDPSSPVSGGAILGDRIRMEDLATDPRIYIRSLATRASLDGLADNLADILAAVAAAGCAEILLETVGVGQVQYAVRSLVDTLVLVLPPGAGDQIQAMKSGVLETADIIVVNKADLPGAGQMATDIRSVLRRTANQGWEPPVVLVSTTDGDSVSRFETEIDRHLAWSGAAGRAAAQEARRAQHVGSLVSRRVAEIVRGLPAEALRLPLDQLYQAVVSRLAQQGETADIAPLTGAAATRLI